MAEVAEACEGLSGRALRKIPFLAHACLPDALPRAAGGGPCPCLPFLASMRQAAMAEKRDRGQMQGHGEE